MTNEGMIWTIVGMMTGQSILIITVINKRLDDLKESIGKRLDLIEKRLDKLEERKSIVG